MNIRQASQLMRRQGLFLPVHKQMLQVQVGQISVDKVIGVLTMGFQATSSKKIIFSLPTLTTSRKLFDFTCVQTLDPIISIYGHLPLKQELELKSFSLAGYSL